MDDARRRSVWSAIWLRKGIVATVPLFAVAASIAVALTTTPTYTASARVLVTNSEQGLLVDPSGDEEVDILTEIQVLQDAVLGEALIGLGDGADDVIDVQVDQVPDTQVVEIAATSTEAETAAEAANVVAAAYVERRREQSGASTGRLLAELREQTAGIKARLDRLDRQIGRESERIDREQLRNAVRQAEAAEQGVDPAPVLPPSTATLDSLRVRYDDLSDRLESLNETADQYELAATLDGGGAEVVNDADVPETPTSPTPLRSAVLAGAVGLVLGVGLALLLDLLDDRIHGVDDVERVVPGLPVLAAVSQRSRRGGGARAQVALLQHVRPSVREAYRTLATTVRLAAEQRSTAVTLITGPSDPSPATAITSNLGVALADLGRRVVVVDGDLCHSRLGWAFDLPVDIGLSTVVSGATTLDQALAEIPVSGEGTLRVLPAGSCPADPVELLASEDVAVIIKRLRESADDVLLDAASLLSTPDALAVAEHADAALLVLAVGRTRTQHIKKAMSILAATGLPVTGGVLISGRKQRFPTLYRSRRSSRGRRASRSAAARRMSASDEPVRP